MKQVSKVMYTIGKVINILELIFSVLMLVCGICFVAMRDQLAGKFTEISRLNTPDEVAAVGITMIVLAVITFVVALLIYIFARKATKALNENSKNTTSHTIMLVIGIFGDVFYFLGGLFGILGINENTQNE